MCPKDKEEENDQPEPDDEVWEDLITVDDDPPIREDDVIKST